MNSQFKALKLKELSENNVHSWFNESLGKNLYYFCFREKIEHFIARFRNNHNYLSFNFSENIKSLEVGARLNTLEELEKFNLELFNKSKEYHSLIDIDGGVCGCNNCRSNPITIGFKRRTGFSEEATPFVNLRFKSNINTKSEYMPFGNKILPNDQCLSQGILITLNDEDRYYFCYDSELAKNAFSKHMQIDINNNNFLFSFSNSNKNEEILVSDKNDLLANSNKSLNNAIVYMKSQFNVDYNAISYRKDESSVYYNDIFDPLIDLFVVLPRDKPFIDSKDTMFFNK
jgi:hypothetical protein